MTDHRSPPPPAERCLVLTYASRGVRGGTLIAEEVTDLATHEQHLRSAGYRPARCLRCGAALHVHDERLRVLGSVASTAVARFRCANRGVCGAVFLVLPAWIARHLWRTWTTVEEAVLASDAGTTAVPARTVARWRARLLASAAAVIVALGGTALGDALASRVGLGGARQEVVEAYADLMHPPPRGLLLAAIAAVIHRSSPGIRLM